MLFEGPFAWYADLWDHHREDPNVLIVFYEELVIVSEISVIFFHQSFKPPTGNIIGPKGCKNYAGVHWILFLKQLHIAPLPHQETKWAIDLFDLTFRNYIHSDWPF